ncbi:immunoglobulin I-set domain protein, partial [Teladorsagia circumcincta]
MQATTETGTEVLESLGKVDETVKEEALQTTEAKPTIEMPKIMRDLKDQTVVKGEQGRFEVVIEHATDTRWYHNGKELKMTTEGVKISEETKYVYKLTIDSSQYPTGTISVKATNETGSVETKCEMKVIEKPELTERLKDIEATLGEPIKVDVAAKGSPQFKWMINGQTLEVDVAAKGSPQFKWMINGQTLEEMLGDLCVRKLGTMETVGYGIITVITVNEAGTEETSSHITVNPKSTAPQIIEGPKSVTITEKETAEFK